MENIENKGLVSFYDFEQAYLSTENKSVKRQLLFEKIKSKLMLQKNKGKEMDVHGKDI